MAKLDISQIRNVPTSNVVHKAELAGISIR